MWIDFVYSAFPRHMLEHGTVDRKFELLNHRIAMTLPKWHCDPLSRPQALKQKHLVQSIQGQITENPIVLEGGGGCDLSKVGHRQIDQKAVNVLFPIILCSDFYDARMFAVYKFFFC